MSSEKEAQDIIHNVWNENTFGGAIGDPDSSVGRMLENALLVLSRDLYGKPSRFLMEMIQNADDNTYTVDEPTLNITYRHSSLRVDCNEIGFSEQNVRAICRIGESTKTGLGNATRYIGEKGIGFKSAFKVAKAVYIKSGFFSFKFDRSQKVGLIAPIWCPFPEAELPGYTSFYLELADDCDQDQIVSELRELDPKMLMFLRQLRRIEIDIKTRQGLGISRKLQRSDISINGALEVTLREGKKNSKFLVIKHPVRNMPPEPKRPGCLETEIMLAFPNVTPAHRASFGPQSVYAFLPVCDCGLQYSLQGDFILTANRESVMDSPWNRALLDASAYAFLTAVRYYNAGPMRYTWPQYLPVTRLSGFFKPLTDKIIGLLQNESILESWDLTMNRPGSVVYVPDPDFLSKDSVPMTLSSQTKSKYLSKQYRPWIRDFLHLMGVAIMDDDMFIRDLKWKIEHEGKAFQDQGSSWHSQLARRLCRLVSNPKYKETLRELPLVPLRDKSWAAAKGEAIFFNRNPRGLSIPTSISIKTTDQEAEKDDNRRSLLAELGVKPCDGVEISMLILERQKSKDFDAQKLTVQQLVAQTAFMFQAKFRPPPDTSMWFATAHCGRCRGPSLYMHGNQPPDSPIALVMKEMEKKYPFIHPDYRDAVPGNRDWLAWIRNSFAVAAVPRIAYCSQEGDGGLRLSPEFGFICRNVPSLVLLSFLMETWGEYSSWMNQVCQDSKRGESAMTPIIESISSILVATTRGNMPLRDTVLPDLDRELAKENNIPFLKLPERYRDAREWIFLERFGVSTRNDVEYYFRCLRSLQNRNAEKAIVSRIYRRIMNEYNGNEQIIWKRFRTERLVYTISGSSGNPPKMKWVDTEQCVEKGYNIESEYDDSAPLWRCLLSKGDGETGSLVAMASMISKSMPLTSVLDRLKKLSLSLAGRSRDQSKKAVLALVDKEILPVRTGTSAVEFDKLLTPTARDAWFVADRDHLHESFLGRVNLLACSPKDVGDLSLLLAAFGHSDRILSELVTTQSTARGRIRPNPTYTRFFQNRAAFLAALVPSADSKHDSRVAQLKAVSVNNAAKVVCKYSFEYRTRKYTGNNGPGEVATSTTDRLNLYVTDDLEEVFPPQREMVKIIINHCGIKNQEHRDLAMLALNEKSDDKVCKEFQKEGFYVQADALPAEPLAEKNKNSKYIDSKAPHSTNPYQRKNPQSRGPADKDEPKAKFASIFSFSLQDGEYEDLDIDSDPRLPSKKFGRIRRKEKVAKGVPDVNFSDFRNGADPTKMPTEYGNLQFLGELVTYPYCLTKLHD